MRTVKVIQETPSLWGKSSIHTVTCKQKIITKSSTEAELVAVDDCIGHVMWLRFFLLEQGYKKAETIIILQDNQSAILLEQNGILSSTKRTKHLNVRYFFIKDKIDSKEVRVEWCPTDKMIADYLTKPLSGDKFKQFRNKIMNLKEFRLVQLGKPSVGDLTTMPILKKAQYSNESNMIQMKGSPANMHNETAEYASLNRSGKGIMIPTKSLVNKSV